MNLYKSNQQLCLKQKALSGNIFNYSDDKNRGSAGAFSGAGYSGPFKFQLGTGRCDIAKTPSLSKRFTVVPKTVSQKNSKMDQYLL
jgi:hypothetical protein